MPPGDEGRGGWGGVAFLRQLLFFRSKWYVRFLISTMQRTPQVVLAWFCLCVCVCVCSTVEIHDFSN